MAAKLEYSRLPLDDDDVGSGSNLLPRLSVVSVAVFATLLIFGVAVLFLSLLSFSTNDKQDSMQITLNRVGYDALDYFDYSVDRTVTYQMLYNYLAVIEPSAPMELHLYDESYLNDENEFTYTVCRYDDSSDCQVGVLNSAMSTSIQFSCDPYDEFSFTIEQTSTSSGETISTTTGKALCVYVRREARTLTDEDRDKLLDAHYMLNIVNQEDGEALYGENYWSAAELVKLHYYNAGQRSSDHVHEGNGFLAQHIKIQNMFELAIQAVDESVYLPYWDYTIENLHGQVVYDSPVVSQWYGNMSAPSDVGLTYANNTIEDGRILDGRWAGLLADINTDFPQLKTGYGYLRAAWSMNPSPYVSRYTTTYENMFQLPSCREHYEVLRKGYTDLMSFIEAVSASPHGASHLLTAGIFGCDPFLDEVAKGTVKDEASAFEMCYTFVVMHGRDFWRKGYWEVPDSCDVNTTDYRSSRCAFVCNENSTDIIVSTFLEHAVTYISDNYTTDADYWEDFVCGEKNGLAFNGDHMEAASPADPSFWVIHPSLERLLQMKYMMGGFEDETWATDVMNSYVCLRPECLDVETMEMGYWDFCCYGHFEGDQLLYYDTADNVDTYVGPTNGDLISGTDPRREDYNMLYIYDNFAYNHCSQDFDSLFT